MRRAALIGALTVSLVPLASPTVVADPGTTLGITAATAGGSTISVSGTVVFGADAVGPVQVGADAALDALTPGVGLDLKSATIQTDLVKKTVTFALNVYDGVQALDGIGPAMGYGWPIAIDGSELAPPSWLGAGNVGSNYPPRTAKWTGFCKVPGGYDCSENATGSMTKDTTRWVLPFMRAANPPYEIKPGTLVSPGGLYAAAPASFYWAFAITQGLAPADVIGGLSEYKVPGEILLGIAPAGTPEGSVQIDTPATLDAAAGSFTGSLPAPGVAGAYTVWAKSCYGVAGSTCVTASLDVTV